MGKSGGRAAASNPNVCKDLLLPSLEGHKTDMSALLRKLQLALILSVSVAIASGLSHLAVGWLGIKVGWGGYKRYGSNDAKVVAALHCSSPGYDAFDWSHVSEVLGGSIESWATAGSSPAEWDAMQDRSPSVTFTFVAVSPYELNDYFLCDFRAEIVPLKQTIRDLQQSGADRSLSKRMLSQYPLMFIRKLFPTAGRSDGVMVGIRAKLQKLAGRGMDAGDAPKFGPDDRVNSGDEERVTDWEKARLQRKLQALDDICMGKWSYNGPKKLALLRLLQRAEAQGRVVMIVVPLSPFFREALMPAATIQKFKDELAELQRVCPQVQIVRLDGLPALNDNNLYCDIIHMNKYGRRIATKALLGRLKALAISK